MRKLSTRLTSTLAIAGLLTSQIGAATAPVTPLSSTKTPAVAWSSGVIRINGADHSGSGNVMPGARLETLRNSGQLYLADGSRLRLAADTRISIQSQSLQLENGAARIDSIAGSTRRLSVSAGVLEIHSAGGTIQRPRPNEIIVTASAFPSEVRKTDGMLIAMVRPGETLAFSVPANAAKSAETLMTGQVKSSNGKYYLTDEVTSLHTELQGGRPANYDGMRVRARGELINSGAEGRRTLVVKEYAMLQQQVPPPGAAGGAAPAGSGGAGAGAGAGSAGAGAGAAGAGAGAGAAGAGAGAGAAGAGAAGAAAAGAGAAAAGAAAASAGAAAAGFGLSTIAVIGGVTAAAVGGTIATVALVNNPSEPISK